MKTLIMNFVKFYENTNIMNFVKFYEKKYNFNQI